MNAEEARAFVTANRRRLKSGWFSEFKYCKYYIAQGWSSRIVKATVYAYFVVGPTLEVIIDIAKFAVWRFTH
jgi:hypothetical protein